MGIWDWLTLMHSNQWIPDQDIYPVPSLVICYCWLWFLLRWKMTLSSDNKSSFVNTQIFLRIHHLIHNFWVAFRRSQHKSPREFCLPNFCFTNLQKYVYVLVLFSENEPKNKIGAIDVVCLCIAGQFLPSEYLWCNIQTLEETF